MDREWPKAAFCNACGLFQWCPVSRGLLGARSCDGTAKVSMERRPLDCDSASGSSLKDSTIGDWPAIKDFPVFSLSLALSAFTIAFIEANPPFVSTIGEDTMSPQSSSSSSSSPHPAFVGGCARGDLGACEIDTGRLFPKRAVVFMGD